MRSVLLAGLFGVSVLLISGTAGSFGQEPKQKDTKADSKAKDSKPEPKVKGQLPTYWGQLGLSAEQKEKIYKLQAKYNEDIDKLEAQIKDLKAKLGKERLDLLTADQKKSLEDILKKKAGGE